MTITTLFDKVSGVYTSYDNTKIVVAGASYKTNQFQGWYCIINDNEYHITSNTETDIFFNNSLTATGNFEIAFVGREFLKAIDSKINDSLLANNNLINNKYNEASFDLQNCLLEQFKDRIRTDYNPLENITNLYQLKYVFAYHMLQNIFFDLGDAKIGGFNDRSIFFEGQYKKSYKIALNSLIVDSNQDGKIDANEKRQRAGVLRMVM